MMTLISKTQAKDLLEASGAFSPKGLRRLYLMVEANPGVTTKEGVEKIIAIARAAAAPARPYRNRG